MSVCLSVLSVLVSVCLSVCVSGFGTFFVFFFCSVKLTRPTLAGEKVLKFCVYACTHTYICARYLFANIGKRRSVCSIVVVLCGWEGGGHVRVAQVVFFSATFGYVHTAVFFYIYFISILHTSNIRFLIRECQRGRGGGGRFVCGGRSAVARPAGVCVCVYSPVATAAITLYYFFDKWSVSDEAKVFFFLSNE